MLTTDFANSIREKYPNAIASDGRAYADIPDQELVAKVVQKYPVYKSQIDDYKKWTALDTFGQEVGQAFEERKEKFVEAVSDFGEKPEDPKTVKDALSNAYQATIRKPLRVVGQVGGLVADVDAAALKLIAPKFIEDLTAKVGQKISETEIAQAALEKYGEFQNKYPEAAQDLEDVLNIGTMMTTVAGGVNATKKAKEVGTKAVEAVDKMIDERRVARIAAASKEIDDVVGTIVQGKKGDIEKAKRALSQIDVSDVKTYSDLREHLEDGVEALTKKVDDTLEKEGKKIGNLTSDKLVTTTKVGGRTVSQNFVEDAINQLDELYAKIKDGTKQAEILNLKDKLSKDGLTPKELNDLARQYSREFSSKAFNKVGDPLTSINAQAFENTRKGIKETVRNLMPDDTTRMLDLRMSEMIHTENLVRKMEEKVNALYQKAQKRGLLEQMARGTADVVNKATFNTLSGFVSRLLPSNVGLKVLNSIDLEKALSKNLKKLDKLLKLNNDKALTKGVVKLIKQSR